jgi:predicted transcriptional regulator
VAGKKITVSVAADVARQVDLAARERRQTRSRFVTEATSARSDAELQRRLDDMFRER